MMSFPPAMFSPSIQGCRARMRLPFGVDRTSTLTCAELDGQVCGSYYLKPNQQGGGAHVANAGYMVSPVARGHHVGRLMAEHSCSEARRIGFTAMQFNFVVSTNEPAIHLWKEFDFEIVGTLPGAFRHPQKGYVDVYVMFRSLIAD